MMKILSSECAGLHVSSKVRIAFLAGGLVSPCRCTEFGVMILGTVTANHTSQTKSVRVLCVCVTPAKADHHIGSANGSHYTFWFGDDFVSDEGFRALWQH